MSLQIRNQQASLSVVFKHSIPSPCSSKSISDFASAQNKKIRIALPKTYHAQAINTKLQLTRFSSFHITRRKCHCSYKQQNTCTEPLCSFNEIFPPNPGRSRETSYQVTAPTRAMLRQRLFTGNANMDFNTMPHVVCSKNY